MFKCGSTSQDVSRIASRYTDNNNVKNASMVINYNSYLRKDEFIVFDLDKAEDDLATRLRFDTPLSLRKEIEVRQKCKNKSAQANE